MKAISLLALLVLCGSLVSASSCEEKAMEQYGISIVPDPDHPGHVMVVQDPTKNKVGLTLKTAQDATSGVPLAGQIVGGIALLFNLGGSYLLNRARAKAAEMNVQHDATHAATNEGLQAFIDAHPKPIGDALIAHLDAAHDEAEIPGHHQDLIQPIAKAA